MAEYVFHASVFLAIYLVVPAVAGLLQYGESFESHYRRSLEKLRGRALTPGEWKEAREKLRKALDLG